MKFEGIMPALVTPLRKNGQLESEALHALIDRLMLEKADGFYIGGATGEGISLTRSLRMQLAEEAIAFIGGKKPAIVHIAATEFEDALALARHAEASGADAISAIPPIFYKYSEGDVYHYYKALADAVHIPLMVYYSPAANFPISASFAARLFEIENVTAIKWTSSDYYGMLCLKDLTHGEMNIINGPDEMLLMGLAAGADGGIGTTYNFMLPRIRRIYDTFREGKIDLARKAQIEADRIIRALLQYPTIPATKVILEAMGFAVGDAAFPFPAFSSEEKKAILSDLSAAGLTI